MNIAVIGAGNIGATLTRRLTAIGHHVSIANSRGPQTLTDLAAETGAVPKPVTDVGNGVDLVIVAVPEQSIAALGTHIRGTIAPSTVVVDAGNYVPHLRDAPIDDLDNGAVESRWTESHLGHAVIKAFNTIVAAHLSTLGKPAGAPDRIALPVAGDDATAKATVIRLANELGFDGMDAGSLDESWRQQPGTPVYTTDLNTDQTPDALAAAHHDQTTAWRARWATAPSPSARR